MTIKAWKHGKKIIRICSAAIILIIILFNVDIWKLLRHLSDFEPLILLFLYAILIIFIISLTAVNYIILGKSLDASISKKSIFWAVFHVWWLTIVTPGRLGELGIIYLLKGKGIDGGKGAAIYFVDKLITFVLLIICGIISGTILFGKTSYLYTGLIALTCLLGGLYLISNINIRQYIRNKLLGRYQNQFYGFYTNIQIILRSRKSLIMNVLNTLFRFWLCGLAGCIILNGFNTNISILTLTCISILNQLISLIPLSISNLGLQEGWFIIALRQYNINAEIALGLCCTTRIINVIISSLFFALTSFLSYRLFNVKKAMNKKGS